MAAGVDRVRGAVGRLHQRPGDDGIPDVVGGDGVEVHPPGLAEARELVDRCGHLIDPGQRGEISVWIACRAMDPGEARGDMHGIEERGALQIAEDRRPPGPILRVGIGGEEGRGIAVVGQQALAVEGMHKENLGAGDKRPVRPEEPLRRLAGIERPIRIDAERHRRRRFGRSLLPKRVSGGVHHPVGRLGIFPRRHLHRHRLWRAVDDVEGLLIDHPVDRHPGELAVGVGEIGGGSVARVLCPVGLRDIRRGGRVGEALEVDRG